jgi:hypothetical protein
VNKIEYIFDDIESCEMIGEFNGEYVYDIEVDDDNHTFIANDILVHNSLFVSFKPAMEHCQWKNLIFDNIDKLKSTFVVLVKSQEEFTTKNTYCLGVFDKVSELKKFLENNQPETIVIDGAFVKNREMKSLDLSKSKVFWNWSHELDFIHGLDHFRYAGYFKEKLDEHAKRYGVENKEDFELERISESIINIAKKKYIQHIVYEDGIPYDRLTYLYPKGVELVRSSTPAFAREKIVDIVKYLFSHPTTFNIKDLLKLVKDLRKEFDLCLPDRIDEISMQSSCTNYETKVLNDKDRLEFVSGTHFAVKSAAYFNYLLHKNKSLQSKYDFIKSGTKIKYYYCKDKSINDTFAYVRGSFPLEFAPDIDLDVQFEKCILSPINSIIEPLGLPTINKRLSVIMDIFSNGF